jgi:hypothetical protein
MDPVTPFEAGIAGTAPTALIEVLDPHDRIHSRYRLGTAGSSCKIGRSVACDIVLDDPYAAAEHTVLVLLTDGRVAVNDLGSRNGTRVDGKLVAGVPTEVTDGELIIGRTRVRIRTALTALTPERLFRRDPLQRHRTFLAAAGLLLVIAFLIFYIWIVSTEPLAPIFTAVIGGSAAIALWAGLWGLISRVVHGAWTMRMHLAIAANMIALCVWSSWLLEAATFATQWRWLEVLAVLIPACAILGSFYLHLRKATHLSIKAAAIAATAIPLALVGTAIWIAQQNLANDVNRIALGPSIYPPQFRIATSTDLGDYVASADTLKREANRKRRISLNDRPLAPSE